VRFTIIFPVLNEEKRLENGIKRTIKYCEENFDESYSIIISDNGSTDNTEHIAKALMGEYNNIKYIKLKEKGVGLALRESIKMCDTDIVGYMDIDLSTDINYLKKVIDMFKKDETIDLIIGSRNSKQSIVKERSIIRTITSYGLTSFINIFLGNTMPDYMCGFKFFKTDSVKKLLNICSKDNGWFYCAELVIVSEWINYHIESIPIYWEDDRANSKVNGKIFKIITDYFKRILTLRKKKSLYLKENINTL